MIFSCVVARERNHSTVTVDQSATVPEYQKMLFSPAFRVSRLTRIQNTSDDSPYILSLLKFSSSSNL